MERSHSPQRPKNRNRPAFARRTASAHGPFAPAFPGNSAFALQSLGRGFWVKGAEVLWTLQVHAVRLRSPLIQKVSLAASWAHDDGRDTRRRLPVPDACVLG